MKHSPLMFLPMLCWACLSTESTPQPGANADVNPRILAAPLTEASSDLAPRNWMGEHELGIWRSPGFQRRFADSYLALSKTEPVLKVDELLVMQELGARLAAEDLDGAVSLMEAQLGADSCAVFDYTLANIYFQQERIEDAVLAYRSALAKFPRYRRAWNNLGLVYALSERFEEAQEALTRVLEVGGGNTDTFGLLGFAYLRSEDYLAAESAYRQAHLLDPSNLDWEMGLAESLFHQGRFEATVSLCTSMIGSAPTSANLWRLQARAYLSLKQPLKAAESFEFLDRMGSADAGSLNLLGDIYTAEGIFEAAADAYVRAYERDLEVGPMRTIRAARALASRGAMEETRTLVLAIEAHAGTDDDLEARKGVLELRARMARTDLDAEAVADALYQLIEIDPLDGEALIQLGQHHERQAELERASLFYERAAGLDGFAARGKRRQAQLLASQGRFREAVPLLKAVLELEPSAGLEDYLAEVERRALQR